MELKTELRFKTMKDRLKEIERHASHAVQWLEYYWNVQEPHELTHGQPPLEADVIEEMIKSRSGFDRQSEEFWCLVAKSALEIIEDKRENGST